MITIDYRYSQSTLQLKVEGHAGYAEEGKDIVCAAVSILLHTLISALEQSGALMYHEVDKGDALVLADGGAVGGIFETVLCGYQFLARECPEYITLRGDLYSEAAT